MDFGVRLRVEAAVHAHVVTVGVGDSLLYLAADAKAQHVLR